jgi:hypothetical protein
MTVITVTAQHIAQGARSNCWRCPIALAVREAFPDTAIAVSDFYIQMTLDGQQRIIRTPRETALFIRAFDTGVPIEPFSFTVDYPEVAE